MVGDAKATLELVFDTAQLKTATTDIKNVGTETTKATTAVTKMGTESKSVGNKIGDIGKKFSGTIASAGALGGTILNLSRQYQDLTDTQIGVDRAQLKVSKTTEATGKAQGILNGLVSKGVTSGASYEKALLDVKQAEEAQSLATQMLTEKQEDHQRAQENFWIGLVPTVTTAGGTIVSMLKEIGGTKGLGGLKTALTGFGGKASGLLGGLVSGLSGIGSAGSGSVAGINGAATATTGLGGAMKATALSMLPVALALGGVALTTKAAGMVIHEIISIMKGDMLEAVKSMQSLIDFYTKIGSVIPMGAGFAIFTALKPEVAKLRAELEKVPQAIKPVSSELQQMDNIGKGMSGTIDNIIGGVLGLTKKADAATPALTGTTGAIGGIGTSASGAGPPVDGLGNSLGSLSNQATITGQGMGTVSTGMIGVAHNAALVTAQTNPFNASLVLVGKNAKIAGQGLQSMAQAAQKSANLALMASQAAMKASQNMAKAAQIGGRPVNNSPYRISNTGGAGKGPKGSHYVTFRNGKPIASGSGMAPPITKVKKAQSGMHEMLKQDTMIMAHAKERVDIDRPSRMERGGGFNGIVNVFIGGKRIIDDIRVELNNNQSVF
jgi:hypothetical protein